MPLKTTSIPVSEKSRALEGTRRNRLAFVKTVTTEFSVTTATKGGIDLELRHVQDAQDCSGTWCLPFFSSLGSSL